MFEDTKEAIRGHKSEERLFNGQNKKDKRASSDPQNTTQKIKDWATNNAKNWGWTQVFQKGKLFLLH